MGVEEEAAGVVEGVEAMGEVGMVAGVEAETEAVRHTLST